MFAFKVNRKPEGTCARAPTAPRDPQRVEMSAGDPTFVAVWPQEQARAQTGRLWPPPRSPHDLENRQ
jgi:hypothetical protein